MAPSRLNALHALARHVGIQPGYIEQNGTPRTTSDAARRALLTALGYEVATASQARATWEALRRTPAPLVAPSQVAARPTALSWAVQAPRALAGRAWQACLTLEDGEQQQRRGRSLGARLPFPKKLPLGYHRLVLEAGGMRAEQAVIVTPPRCPTPAKAAQKSGIWANLYTVHNARSWGFGDLGCLRQLVQWAAQQGAHFVGINPLHALRNRDGDISPYSGVSRLYRNALYLDVEAIDEFRDSPKARAILRQQATALTRLRQAPMLDYTGVLQLKMAVLTALHAVFAQHHTNGATPRGKAYQAFCAAQGPTLDAFALFCALDQHFAAQGKVGGWPSWPEAFRTPDTAAVRQFAAANPQAIDLQRYIQFELDNQLRQVAVAAREGGMAVGLYQDLAIGTALGGAEPWLFPRLFVPTISVGAPPDAYAPLGQDWGLPPMHPGELQRTGYAYWRKLLQSALAHSGALRVDHILGMFRLFWIPRGTSAKLGAYVRYPRDDLLGILALESHRAGAQIIGEDLGTVPRGVAPALRQWNILSSKVMYFEQTRSGSFRAAKSYSDRALVTATTHDHVPIAGFQRARDCTLRHQVGHIPSAKGYKQALAHRTHELSCLVRRLQLEQCLPLSIDPSSVTSDALIAAIHAFLRKTPAPLIGISLDDIAGETEPVNIPGATGAQYPCWSRRLSLSLEELANSDLAIRRWNGSLRK